MLSHKRILSVIDGTPAGLNALEQVVRVTDQATALGAISVTPSYNGDLRLVGVSDIAAKLDAPYVKALGDAEALATRSERPIEILRVSGQLHEGIADAALANDYDLIVQGLGSRQLFEGAYTTGMAGRVIGYSPADVLIVPQNTSLGLETILLAYDGSPFSQVAVERALALARTNNASLTVLKVIDVPVEYAAMSGGMTNKLFAKARALLHDVKVCCEEAGVEATFLVEHGDPATTIATAARRIQAGLIVMGWLGKTGLVRLLMGSVVEKILATRRHCVLIAKNAVFASG